MNRESLNSIMTRYTERQKSFDFLQEKKAIFESNQRKIIEENSKILEFHFKEIAEIKKTLTEKNLKYIETKNDIRANYQLLLAKQSELHALELKLKINQKGETHIRNETFFNSININSENLQNKERNEPYSKIYKSLEFPSTLLQANLTAKEAAFSGKNLESFSKSDYENIDRLWIQKSNESEVKIIEEEERKSSNKSSEIAVKDHEDKVRQISELIESKERLLSQSEVSQELTIQEKENCTKQKKELDLLVRMLDKWKVKLPAFTLNDTSYNKVGNDKLIYNERWAKETDTYPKNEGLNN